jgi:predicted metal-dependent TIM-barrel fold hydrolase
MALVPESAVRFGTHEPGQDGVQSLKVVDSRIIIDHLGISYLKVLDRIIYVCILLIILPLNVTKRTKRMLILFLLT